MKVAPALSSSFSSLSEALSYAKAHGPVWCKDEMIVSKVFAVKGLPPIGRMVPMPLDIETAAQRMFMDVDRSESAAVVRPDRRHNGVGFSLAYGLDGPPAGPTYSYGVASAVYRLCQDLGASDDMRWLLLRANLPVIGARCDGRTVVLFAPTRHPRVAV